MALHVFRYIAFSFISACIVTGILVLIAPPLAALTRRIVYGSSKPDLDYPPARTSR